MIVLLEYMRRYIFREAVDNFDNMRGDFGQKKLISSIHLIFPL